MFVNHIHHRIHEQFRNFSISFWLKASLSWNMNIWKASILLWMYTYIRNHFRTTYKSTIYFIALSNNALELGLYTCLLYMHIHICRILHTFYKWSIEQIYCGVVCIRPVILCCYHSYKGKLKNFPCNTHVATYTSFYFKNTGSFSWLYESECIYRYVFR